MRARLIAVIVTTALLASCKASDVLSVPPPATQFGTGAPGNQHEAEIAYAGAKITFFQGLDGGNIGLLFWVEELTDEFANSGGYAVTDARFTSAALFPDWEVGDQPLQALFNARSSLLLAVAALQRYEPDSGQFRIGEAYALVGYIELTMAEDYCAGVTLSSVPDGGGITYGRPLTTDSLLAVAEMHFESAIAHAHGDATVQSLASVGLGRARLNRAHYAQAAAAVAEVPTNFVYNVELSPTDNGAGSVNMYTIIATDLAGGGCAGINVADREGANGLNFVAAHDRRLVLDSTTMRPTCDGYYYGLPDTLFYYPAKFGNPPTGLVPLATGVEGRLIAAEAALASNAVGTWAADLNALRAAAPSTYLALAGPMDPLPTDSTTGASATEQVDVMFRERAFWLFGTGIRLGDLRRLIRQYHRDQRIVFPAGPFLHNDPGSTNTPIPNYGSDVSFTLPTPGGSVTVTNPYYKGCLTSPGTA